MDSFWSSQENSELNRNWFQQTLLRARNCVKWITSSYRQILYWQNTIWRAAWWNDDKDTWWKPLFATQNTLSLRAITHHAADSSTLVQWPTTDRNTELFIIHSVTVHSENLSSRKPRHIQDCNVNYCCLFCYQLLVENVTSCLPLCGPHGEFMIKLLLHEEDLQVPRR